MTEQSGNRSVDIFDPSHYTEVRKPLAQASTLPPWCYTSPAFHAREVERIFGACWHLVGREDEAGDPGDYLTLETPAGSALVVRGEDGTLRGFLNACRHRGTLLLEDRGHCRSIVCPYHSWRYGLDGSLLHARGMQSVTGFRPEEHGLLAVRLESWGGFLFACFDRSAPTLREWLGDMPDRFAAHRPADMVCVRRIHYPVACNWKLLIENSLEAYHTGSVHAATLGQQAARQLGPTRGNWDGLLIEGEESIAVLPGRQRPFDPVPGLGGDAAAGTFFTVIYPCTQLAFAQDCAWWLAIRPAGVDQCRLELGLCFPRDTVRRPDFGEAVQAYYARWEAATPEDNAISERQQRGQAAGSRPPGRFGPEEYCVHRLARWVLDRVLGEESAAVPVAGSGQGSASGQ